MPGPESPPKTARKKTKINCPTIDTAVILSVPRLPTIRLSTRLTALVIPFCIIIGTASNSAFLYTDCFFISFFLPLFSIGLFQTMSFFKVHCITDNICFSIILSYSVFYNVLGFIPKDQQFIAHFAVSLTFSLFYAHNTDRLEKCKSTLTPMLSDLQSRLLYSRKSQQSKGSRSNVQASPSHRK